MHLVVSHPPFHAPGYLNTLKGMNAKRDQNKNLYDFHHEKNENVRRPRPFSGVERHPKLRLLVDQKSLFVKELKTTKLELEKRKEKGEKGQLSCCIL